MSVMEEDAGALIAADRLPADLMLLKMENEQIFAVAKMQPREPMKIVAQLQELIDAYPAAAGEAIYRKPVGNVIEVTCSACGVKFEVVKLEQETTCPACDVPAIQKGKSVQTRKVKKFAEGLSIRAAESIRSIYGYTRLATTAEEIDGGKVKLTGCLVDYAAGNITSDERIVSPMYRSRTGQMVRTPEDRFLNVTVKAEKAKLRRDVILDSVPNIIKAAFRDACERKMGELVSEEFIEQRIIPAFASYGVTAEHLARIIGRPHKLGWSEAERLGLRKLLTGLKNGETTVAELIADLDETEPQTAMESGGATLEDLAKPAADPPLNPPLNPPTPEEITTATAASAEDREMLCEEFKQTYEFVRSKSKLAELDKGVKAAFQCGRLLQADLDRLAKSSSKAKERLEIVQYKM